MIHLVHMPFGSVAHPSLALGLLKAQLTDAGLPARVHHLNLDLGSRLGFPAYETLALMGWDKARVGEWLFAREAWGEEVATSDRAFLEGAHRELEGLPLHGDPLTWLHQVREEVVPRFLDDAVRRLEDDGGPEVVGFTCTFFQTVPALALARRLVEHHPGCRIVLGGSCLHGDMGRELLRGTPWIHAVSLGEADDVAVPLLRALASGEEPSDLPGIAYRSPDGALRETAAAQVSAATLEALPHPDYDDYFVDLEDVGLAWDPEWHARAFLPFDAARGCWWGEHHHCTFCGLNSATMAFRARSGERVEAQLRHLAERYPIQRLHAADNILPRAYHRTLLPRLAREPLPREVSLFYEVKANLTREEVFALAAAGVRTVQPGLESLDTRLLGLLRKGVTALQNVYFLRCCREAGVLPLWNLLLGIPGEAPEDYERIAARLPRLVHLQPPVGGPRRIELHRFSPYFEDASAHGTKTPHPGYRALFPEARFDLSRVAYTFEATWPDRLDPGAYAPVEDATRAWMRIWASAPVLPSLTRVDRPDGTLELLDTRGDEPLRWPLDRVQSVLYEAIDEPAGDRVAHARLEALGFRGPTRAQVRDVLEAFAAHGIAYQEGNTFVALALPEGCPGPDLATRRQTYAFEEPSRG